MNFYITREFLPFLFLFTTLFFFSILVILVSLVVWGLGKKIFRTASRYVTALQHVLADRQPSLNLATDAPGSGMQAVQDPLAHNCHRRGK